MARKPRTSVPQHSLPGGLAWKPKIETIKAVLERYPQVDIAGTIEWFVLKADSVGWHYSNWESAFRIYVMNGIEKDYGGVKFTRGIEADPKWKKVLSEAAQYPQFRKPYCDVAGNPRETPAGYETSLRAWIANDKSSNVARLPVPLRKFS